jgi:Double-stranded RNA binding motif
VRNNMKLRKLLAPKNALMAFNELLQGTTPAEFKLESNGQNFVAEVVFNNIKYEGYGTSKNTAKNDACEKAVRDLIIAKLSKVQKQETVAKPATDDVEMMDADSANDGDDDDVPMLQLASFALHKLFAEWSAEGFEIPSTKLTAKSSGGGGVGGGSVDQPMDGTTDDAAIVGAKAGQPKKTILKTELPANASEMHPTMLLSAMRAGIFYEDLGCTGPVGSVVQNCGVTVDGRRFEGSGRSKKLARKAAASKACNEIFGTAFTEETN